MLRILKVDERSLAARRGLKGGDKILTINGEKVLDLVDYQALTSKRYLNFVVEDSQGKRREVDIIHQGTQPLGIHLEQETLPAPRECANQCIFCFVDQMPGGMRPSLYIKDDDWRYSLLTGSFITLTNVSDSEFERILRRKASPLYISVHATDDDVREKMLRTPLARGLVKRLQALKDHNLSFHAQVVLVPGVNDGRELEKTLGDLEELRPAALSCAIVPVGLTCHRKGLEPLVPYTKEQALEVLSIVDSFRKKSLEKYGNAFVYPADEFVALAEKDIPPAIWYDDYPQIENGVGMLRLMEDSLKAAQTEKKPASSIRYCIPCGQSVYPYLKKWMQTYFPDYLVTIVPIRNDFFGPSDTVTGLLTAGDILNQVNNIPCDVYLISESMLDNDDKKLLDDVSLEGLEKALGKPVRIVRNNGFSFFEAIQ
jgi:putative radical SAM enzyme (TIGR03279 family)